MRNRAARPRHPDQSPCIVSCARGAAAALVAGLLCLTAGDAGLSARQAQDAPPAGQAADQEQPPPRFRTEANFVRVDAYPTRDGKPVQDLSAADFEVLENGAPQRIEAFEHVVITPAGPDSLRIDPGSVQQAEQLAANPRSRVFVVFLDIPHVGVEGSHAIKEPLIRLMDRVLGDDDLVAFMTPLMSAAQVTFGRKTQVVAEMLRENWTWGHRHQVMPMDDREMEYERCYPGVDQRPVVLNMIARRRERIVLDALRDLVTYLGGLREERKAILTVSDGWVLYGPDASITRPRVVDRETGETEPVPGREPVGVDQFGKLRVGAARSREGYAVSQTECDRERMHLAAIDNDEYFRRILDLANRQNATFYPVDPRGLSAFDSPMGPATPPHIITDRNLLRRRSDTLRTLAENTDGIAVMDSNDLDRGLRRIADDLTSYYLLGYYSTNTTLDGGYRRITVRVKQPGVDVRARRGYRAPTAEEVNASRAAAAAPVPESARATAAALAALERMAHEQRLSVHAVPVSGPSGAPGSLWVAGEVRLPMREFSRGGTAVVELLAGDGTAAGTASATLKPGERAFLVQMGLPDGGAVSFDVRAQVTQTGGTDALTSSVRVESAQPQPLAWRRGPSTGNQLRPAAQFEFSRTERVRFELPLAGGAKPGTAQLLDRTGEPLPVPLQVGERTDPDGRRWLTADATLAALGAGDYVVELSRMDGGTEQRVITAIRVTR